MEDGYEVQWLIVIADGPCVLRERKEKPLFADVCQDGCLLV
jgi:hypothetical protein